MMNYFFLPALKILSILREIESFESLIITLWFSVWVSVSSPDLEFIKLLGCLFSCLSSNWECFHPLFLQVYSVPLFLSLLFLGHKYFYFCYLDLLISIVLSSGSVILSSAFSNLLLDSSSAFFIVMIVLFSTRISFGFFLVF